MFQKREKDPICAAKALLDQLKQPMKAKSNLDSLISLPHPHIIPGGRFREIYYWDSFFSYLPLNQEEKNQVVENFCSLLKQYGFIPNGNRTYYLSRSQPPLLYSLLAQINDLQSYRFSIEKEYAFWMQEEKKSRLNGIATLRCVPMPDQSILNRYWDSEQTPRPESYYEDYQLANCIEHGSIFRHIRAACESGWDFSSRWLDQTQDLNTIQTTKIIPIELNCLLYEYEKFLGLNEKAEKRKNAIHTWLWDSETNFFCDWNHEKTTRSPILSLASLFPLWKNLATKKQAQKIAERIEDEFLCEGGLLTTPIFSGQQWDAPNGWAPLHWIAIMGLNQYGFHSLAKEIKKRFTNTIEWHFLHTGYFMEKYNVVDPTALPKKGEYPNQIGFGWTLGVYLALKKLED